MTIQEMLAIGPEVTTMQNILLSFTSGEAEVKLSELRVKNRKAKTERVSFEVSTHFRDKTGAIRDHVSSFGFNRREALHHFQMMSQKNCKNWTRHPFATKEG